MATIPTPNNELPATHASAVTPHDTTGLPYFTRALYIGGAGNLTVKMNGANVLFTAVPAGMILPIRTNTVLATGTTATSIVALY